MTPPSLGIARVWPPYQAVARDLERVLRDWTAPDGEQEALREQYLAHLEADPMAVSKGGPPAHFTAGCLIYAPDRTAVLLTLHAKARRWFQMGGHIEGSDLTISGAAAREALEESGLVAGEIEMLPDPVHLDRHDLPGAFGRCREHLDVRYAAVAVHGAIPRISAESLDLAWWPIDGLPEGSEDLRPLVQAGLDALERA